MTTTREQQIEKVFFQGSKLTLGNPTYLQEVRTFTEALLRVDLTPTDLTVEALGFGSDAGSAMVVARERGVAAGLCEVAFLLERFGISVEIAARDGEIFEQDDVLLRARGPRGRLLSVERVGLNLLQRMSGIATATRCLQDRVLARSSTARVVATRKTLWGLLDKRAVHLGGGGTHRLGLGDAILIKNNHLALLAGREAEAAPIAVEKAWNYRKRATFIEVEVRDARTALAAAQTFRRLQDESGDRYPSVLMLDNMLPEQIDQVLADLEREGLWDRTLIEASGGISAANIEQYAACRVDAISVGALTHSARAVDFSQRIS